MTLKSDMTDYDASNGSRDNNEAAVRVLINQLPHIDTHCHFEGAIPWALIRQFHPRRTSLPEKPPWYSTPDYFSSFGVFLDLFRDYIRPCLTSIDRYKSVAEHLCRSFLENQSTYAEWNVSVSVIQQAGLSMEAVFSTIHDVISVFFPRQSPPIRLIAGINRELSLPEKNEILIILLGLPSVAGVDLHGWERDLDLAEHTDFFRQAGTRDWKIKVHAGELASAENVRIAVYDYGVRYICHGLRAYEDDALLDVLCKNDVFLEMSPTSNLALQVLPAGHIYPLVNYLQRGINVTLNTDDPMIFGNSLHDEFIQAYRMGVTLNDLAVLAMNAVQATLLPDRKKAAIQKDIMDLVIAS